MSSSNNTDLNKTVLQDVASKLPLAPIDPNFVKDLLGYIADNLTIYNQAAIHNIVNTYYPPKVTDDKCHPNLDDKSTISNTTQIATTVKSLDNIIKPNLKRHRMEADINHSIENHLFRLKMNYLKEAQKRKNRERDEEATKKRFKMMTMVNLPSDNDE
jgi:hypothetical protein